MVDLRWSEIQAPPLALAQVACSTRNTCWSKLNNCSQLVLALWCHKTWSNHQKIDVFLPSPNQKIRQLALGFWHWNSYEFLAEGLSCVQRIHHFIHQAIVNGTQPGRPFLKCFGEGIATKQEKHGMAKCAKWVIFWANWTPKAALFRRQMLFFYVFLRLCCLDWFKSCCCVCMCFCRWSRLNPNYKPSKPFLHVIRPRLAVQLFRCKQRKMRHVPWGITLHMSSAVSQFARQEQHKDRMRWPIGQSCVYMTHLHI